MKIIATAAAAAAIGAFTLASVTPALSQTFHQRHNYVQNYCSNNPNDDDCEEFASSNGNWNDEEYRNWYGKHGNRNDNIAAGIFGFAAGAIIGGALANSNNNNGGGGQLTYSHVRACEARYQSYDRATDTFLGFDGDRHYCRL